MDGRLIFSKTTSQSGFTNASIATSNNKSISTIVREILQNSYDSAILDKGSNRAEVTFIVENIDVLNIPDITNYKNAINAVENTSNLTAQEKNILNTIKNELQKEKIPVLFVIDNGVGFTKDKLVSVLSDGISNKNNPNDSSGSYGNGHFSTFNISNLRYCLYGGKLEKLNIFSAHTILRTHKIDNELKSSNGYFITRDMAILEENDIYVTNEYIPQIMSNKFELIKDTGAVLAILGFNFFDDTKDRRLYELISGAIVSNFFAAIHNDLLRVKIIENSEEKLIDKLNLNTILKNTKRSEPKNASMFYDILLTEQKQEIQTDLGMVDVYVKQPSQNETKLAICRNGMWISDSLRSPLNPAQFLENKNFLALIMPRAKTEFASLIREAEGNLHKEIALNRLPKDKKERLYKALDAIKTYLQENVNKSDNINFEVEIPELTIEMIGDIRSKSDTNINNKNTNIKEKKINLIPSYDEKYDEEQESKTQNKSNKKQPFGNQISIQDFISRHDIKSKTAYIKFTPQTNKNLFLFLSIDDGTDATCDHKHLGQKIIIKSAKSSQKNYKIIENGVFIDELKIADTITIEILYEMKANNHYTINYDFRIAKENI